MPRQTVRQKTWYKKNERERNKQSSQLKSLFPKNKKFKTWYEHKNGLIWQEQKIAYSTNQSLTEAKRGCSRKYVEKKASIRNIPSSYLYLQLPKIIS